MADWVGVYAGDLGQDYSLALHRCYLVVEGTRSASQATTDSLYLPPVWLAHCQPRDKAACEFVGLQRTIRAYFAPAGYLAIPWPWRGGTAAYRQGLEELRGNPAIFGIEMVGESLNPFWTEHLANK